MTIFIMQDITSVSWHLSQGDVITLDPIREANWVEAGMAQYIDDQEEGYEEEDDLTSVQAQSVTNKKEMMQMQAFSDKLQQQQADMQKQIERLERLQGKANVAAVDKLVDTYLDKPDAQFSVTIKESHEGTI